MIIRHWGFDTDNQQGGMRKTPHLYTWVDWMKDSASTWNTVDVYSIDKKITRIAGTSMLEKRTETPLSLSEGLSLCRRLETEGHVVELRRIS
jgi:hypothetical protein